MKCTACKEELDPSRFSPDKRNRSGLHSQCKACRARNRRNRFGKGTRRMELAQKLESQQVCKTKLERKLDKEHAEVMRIRMAYLRAKQAEMNTAAKLKEAEKRMNRTAASLAEVRG